MLSRKGRTGYKDALTMVSYGQGIRNRPNNQTSKKRAWPNEKE